MSKIDFDPISIDIQDKVREYTARFGEGACQHSPVSMYSLYHKYGDAVSISGDFLYVLREYLCDEDFRVYLAPLGGGDLVRAYERILEDAHSYGKRVAFISLTKKHAQFLGETFGEKFSVIEERDLFEYIYSVRTMLEFPGKIHERRRTEIRSFWRDFGDRTVVTPMTGEDTAEVLAFAGKWLKDNAESHDEEALINEMLCIKKQLDHFTELNITGTVIRIDGEIGGFCYGTPLNEDYYDVLIEKGDRSFPGIYRVIRQESTKLNLTGFSYINFEEDMGVEGLRKVKKSYGPEYMIEKYIAREK